MKKVRRKKLYKPKESTICTTNTAGGISIPPGPVTPRIAGVTFTLQGPSKKTPARITSILQRPTATTPAQAFFTTK